MHEAPTPLPPADSRGTRAALVFALTAERLRLWYDHARWPTDAQGANLAADWLARSKRSLPLAERQRLSALSDHMARHIADSLSREAGLHAVHEMTEALDPRYDSDLARALMAECERLLDET